jgi:hypothetical protein
MKTTMLAAALCIQCACAGATELRSAAKLTFGDDGTLFIADWKAARIYAVRVAAVKAAQIGPFNLQDVQQPIADALKVPLATLRFEDLAVQPGGGIAYVSLSVGANRAAVVAIDAAGKVTRLALGELNTWAAITDAPARKVTFWRDLPAQSLTVTDMKFYRNKLYVAGLSNRSFASALRVYDYPFKGRAHTATIEMYHPVHDELETRAPIRSLAIVNAGGVPSLLAAYTCTPLVLIALDQLKDGAHIAAKTIGEMGWGSAPVGMVSYKMGEADYVLLANSSRAADLMAVADIAYSATLPGLSRPIEWPAKPYAGVKGTMTPLAAVMRIDNLNDKLLLALRRDAPTGRMQLVSIPKGVYLRLSDFVNEYDFKDYVYPATDKFRDFHKYGRAIEGYPELAR